jgi:hypothetical protein
MRSRYFQFRLRNLLLVNVVIALVLGGRLAWIQWKYRRDLSSYFTKRAEYAHSCEKAELRLIDQQYKLLENVKRGIEELKLIDANMTELVELREQLRLSKTSADETAVICRIDAAAFARIRRQCVVAASHPWARGNLEIPEGDADWLSEFPDIPRPAVPPFPNPAAFWP